MSKRIDYVVEVDINHIRSLVKDVYKLLAPRYRSGFVTGRDFIMNVLYEMSRYSLNRGAKIKMPDMVSSIRGDLESMRRVRRAYGEFISMVNLLSDGNKLRLSKDIRRASKAFDNFHLELFNKAIRESTIEESEL